VRVTVSCVICARLTCTMAHLYHRYYHLFKEAELPELLNQIPGVTVQSTYWEKDNWHCVARRDS
jgi:hypothetical protein